MDVPIARRIPRLSWLNGRMILGVLLLAVAFVAGQRLLADARRSTGVWAAARDLPRDSELTSTDLKLTEARLPADVLSRYAPSSMALEGTVLTRPVRAGELIPLDGVARDPALPEGRSITIPVAPEHAVGGALRAGDRVDVFATFDAGEAAALTSLLVGDVEVTDVVTTGSLVGAGESVIGLTVVVTPEEAARLAFAVRNGEIDIARVDGKTGAASPTIRSKDFR